MNMKYRWLLIMVLAAGCWIAYAYMPHSAVVQDGVVVVEEVKETVRIPNTQQTMQADILEIKASLSRIEGLLAEHSAANELRFARIEAELKGR